MVRALAVMVGGALGALGRYAVSGFIARITRQTPFPWGTMVVNLLGALLLGLLMGAGTTGRLALPGTVRTLLAVGLLGAFTTFSTFTYETVEALRVGDVRLAMLNVVVSVAVGLTACWFGLRLGGRL